MAETKEIIIAVIGYIIALISPILGIIAGAIIFFTQMDNPFFNRHGKLIIVVAIAAWLLGIALVAMGVFKAP